MRFLTVLASGVILASSLLSAQSRYVVVPSGFENAPPHTTDPDIFVKKYMPYHGQWIYDFSAFPAGLNRMNIKGMALRRTRLMPSYKTPSATADLEIVLSIGPRDSRNTSLEYMKNMGKVSLLVLPRTQVYLPRVPSTKNAPAWNVSIPFKRPFAFTRKIPSTKSLVVDIKVYNYTSSPWFLDSAAQDTGTHRTVLSYFKANGCRFSNGYPSRDQGSAIYDLVPGGYFTYIQNYVPKSCKGALILGIRLFPKGGISFPGAGTCRFLVVPILAMATVGGTWPRISIPNDPALAGGEIFTQAVYVDPRANSMGMVASPVLGWRIGSGKTVHAVSLHEPCAPAGSKKAGIRLRSVPLVRFTY